MEGKCPVDHSKLPMKAAAPVAAVAKPNPPEPRAEPADKPDRNLDVASPHSSSTLLQHNELVPQQSNDPRDRVPDLKIPAAGRGNSNDGKHWVNPSANQLFRALQRKNKPIEHADAMDVAQVHNMVTEESWKGVMQYEALHAGSCAQPTLAKFQGMDGIYSAKARFSHLMGWTPLPFDRHDWTVNRCGKEVRYIIDYYAVEEKDGDISYFIDARPAPTLGGVYDRVRLAARKWWRGEKVW